jgi:hypothetical protein
MQRTSLEKLIASRLDVFTATQRQNFLAMLTDHWRTKTLVSGATTENETTVLSYYDDADPSHLDAPECAERHLLLIIKQLFAKLGYRFSDDRRRGEDDEDDDETLDCLDGLERYNFRDISLEIKPQASGVTEYHGSKYEWTVDGSAQLVGFISRDGRPTPFVKVVCPFVSHPFHQYRAIKV